MRRELNREVDLCVANIYTQARVLHIKLKKVEKYGNGPHEFEPSDDPQFSDRTDAKKPCWLCGAGKRAKIHG